jgi:hypothetical protein
VTRLPLETIVLRVAITEAHLRCGTSLACLFLVNGGSPINVFADILKAMLVPGKTHLRMCGHQDIAILVQESEVALLRGTAILMADLPDRFWM